MNNQRRIKLNEGIKKLNEAQDIFQDVLSDESFSFESLSEGLQQTMRGEQMEENVNILEETVDKISDILEDLNTID